MNAEYAASHCCIRLTCSWLDSRGCSVNAMPAIASAPVATDGERQSPNNDLTGQQVAPG